MMQASSQIEQYRLAMRIIKAWDMWRTPTLIGLAVCVALFIIFFIFRKKGFAVLFLFFSLVLGGTAAGLDWFKDYVAQKKREAINKRLTAFPRTVGKITETVTKPVTEPLKKILPFGK